MRMTAGKEIRFVQALRSRAFAWFWGGQTVSALGDGAFATALAVAVYQLTGSSLAMGLFLMAQILPELFFTLIGGVAADRLPRRLVLLFSDAGRAGIVCAIALLAWLHLLQLWHLFVLAVLFGVVASFFHPSYRALMPELVSREHLASANALTELSEQLGSLLGPMLGAGLIALSTDSASLAFAFDGLTFVASVCSLAALRSLPRKAPIQADEGEKQIDTDTGVSAGRGLRSMGRDIRDGFGTIRRSTWLLCSMIVAAFALMCYRGAMSVALPKLVFAVYGAGPWLLTTGASFTKRTQQNDPRDFLSSHQWLVADVLLAMELTGALTAESWSNARSALASAFSIAPFKYEHSDEL